jgi:hypothetical protein
MSTSGAVSISRTSLFLTSSPPKVSSSQYHPSPHGKFARPSLALTLSLSHLSLSLPLIPIRSIFRNIHTYLATSSSVCML